MNNEPSSETPLPTESASDESIAIADSDASTPERATSSRRILIGFAIGCAISLAIVVPAEIDRWTELTGEPGTAWLFDMNIDTTP